MSLKENIKSDLTALIGGTPLLRLTNVAPDLHAELVVKLENANPGGSVKDRIALAMIEAAEADGLLGPGGTIVEPTSGNTGIGLAWVGAVKGYRVILTMPETMSGERRGLLRALGAELVLTHGADGMEGAIAEAVQLVGQIDGAFMPQQFKNPANPAVHRRTTAREIWADCGGRIDAFVAGVGTGGTVTGVGAALKALDPSIRVVALEPDRSPVLSGGAPGPHMIQGIGAGFIPDVYDGGVVDEVMTITNDEAMATSRRLAKREGLLVGISAGGNVAGALRLAARPEMKGARILTVMCDTGERYLSTPLYDET